jgi:hypothetical protein
MSAQSDAAVGDDYTTSQWLPDQLEAAKMEPFNPLASEGVPWWQAVASYGITRAIDNRYGPTNVGGNTQAGSFGGANGRSYLNNGSAVTGGGLLPGVDNRMLLLGLAAIAAVVFFNKG